MMLILDVIKESKRKCKIDYDAKRSCEVMTVDEKIKTTLRWCFTLMLNFPILFY
jgi:hypothetical protein